MSVPLLGTGSTATLPAGSTETLIFDGSQNGGPVAGYRLKNNDASLVARIRVHGMHLDQTAAGGGDGMAQVAAGESILFAIDGNGIDKITGYGDGGTLSLTGYVQSRR